MGLYKRERETFIKINHHLSLFLQKVLSIWKVGNVSIVAPSLRRYGGEMVPDTICVMLVVSITEWMEAVDHWLNLTNEW